MGYISVTITLTLAGTNLGPFDLYTDADNFATPIVQGLSVGQLTAGYTCTIVPDTATIIRVQSTGVCDNYIDLPIYGLPLPTPTPTPVVTPTSTPVVTPTPTSEPLPTLTASSGLYTVILVPEVVEVGYYPSSSERYKTRVKSFVYVSPSLPSGHSFRLNYKNSASVSATDPLPHPITSTSGRKIEGSASTFDKAFARLSYTQTNDNCGDPSTVCYDENDGNIIINTTNYANGTGNRIYFIAESVSNLSNDPDTHNILSKVVLLSVEEVTGGGTYVLGDSDDDNIIAYVP